MLADAGMQRVFERVDSHDSRPSRTTSSPGSRGCSRSNSHAASEANVERQTAEDVTDVPSMSRRRGGVQYTLMEAKRMQEDLHAKLMEHVGNESELLSEEESDITGIEDQDKGGFSSARWFQHATGLVIGLNTVMIAAEAAYIRHDELKGMFFNFEFAFTFLYVLELSVRIRELGFRNFVHGREWPWNIFDFAITTSGVMDTILGAMGRGGVGASAGRLFRVLRILRLFRALKFLKNMDYVIATAAKATMKLAFLVILVVFVSSIIFTNMLWDTQDDQVNQSFGDLGRSMWTMFTLMTLENWTNIVSPVLEIKPTMRVPIILFIFFASIALMSLVPAIFIELNMSEREMSAKELETREKEKRRRVKKKVLEIFFQEADHACAGHVTSVQMLDALQRGQELWSTSGELANISEEEMHHMKLVVFDLCEKKHREGGGHIVEFTLQELTAAVMATSYDIDSHALWCSLAVAREGIHELAGLVQDELPSMQKAIVKIVREQQEREFWELRKELDDLRRVVSGVQTSVAQQAQDHMKQAEATHKDVSAIFHEFSIVRAELRMPEASYATAGTSGPALLPELEELTGPYAHALATTWIEKDQASHVSIGTSGPALLPELEELTGPYAHALATTRIEKDKASHANISTSGLALPPESEELPGLAHALGTIAIEKDQVPFADSLAKADVNMPEAPCAATSIDWLATQSGFGELSGPYAHALTAVPVDNDQASCAATSIDWLATQSGLGELTGAYAHALTAVPVDNDEG